MERLVESIHVPCPNAAHGCTVRPAYYDKHNHLQTCGHTPYHCPGEACDFIGTMAVLMDHFSGVHSWPCTTKVRAGKKCPVLQDLGKLCREYLNIRLHDGFYFVLADHTDNSQGAAASASPHYLFLLNVVWQQLVHGISVLCIHPNGTAISGDGQGPSLKEMKCELSYTRFMYGNSHPQLTEHFQKSGFRVASTDLSNGLPGPDGCFQFVVPDSLLADSEKDAILVTARFVID
uniref:SIAH-type domain-containing protein n=1 Tax=Arundo donax TaxID=35708 RepID=A0A0A9E324_ARUDO